MLLKWSVRPRVRAFELLCGSRYVAACERCRFQKVFGRQCRRRFASSSSRSSRKKTRNSRGRKPSTKSLRDSTTRCPNISSRRTGLNSSPTPSRRSVPLDWLWLLPTTAETITVELVLRHHSTQKKTSQNNIMVLHCKYCACFCFIFTESMNISVPTVFVSQCIFFVRVYDKQCVCVNSGLNRLVITTFSAFSKVVINAITVITYSTACVGRRVISAPACMLISKTVQFLLACTAQTDCICTCAILVTKCVQYVGLFPVIINVVGARKLSVNSVFCIEPVCTNVSKSTISFAFCYFASGRGAKYCDQRARMSVCLSVCLSARISQKPHVHISPNFLYMLLVVVALSSSDGNAICYVLPILRMTSCFHIMEGIVPNRRRRVRIVQFAS